MKQLTAEIMGGVNHVLAKHIDSWVDYHTECKACLSTHLSDIKFNVKRANEAGQLQDLLFELQMGCLLSLNWPNRVRYNRCDEPGPDYAVSPRTEPFNVEVTHLKNAEDDRDYPNWIKWHKPSRAVNEARSDHYCQCASR